MEKTGRKKQWLVTLGLVTLALLAFLWMPFFTTPKEMRAYCEQLTLGTTMDAIKESSAPRGYKVTDLKDGGAVVHEPRSMGRFVCNLQFEEGKLKSSKYNFND